MVSICLSGKRPSTRLTPSWALKKKKRVSKYSHSRADSSVRRRPETKKNLVQKFVTTFI